MRSTSNRQWGHPHPCTPAQSKGSNCEVAAHLYRVCFTPVFRRSLVTSAGPKSEIGIGGAFRLHPPGCRRRSPAHALDQVEGCVVPVTASPPRRQEELARRQQQGRRLHVTQDMEMGGIGVSSGMTGTAEA